ncbi:DUF262 domain-containing protein [candidate division KSB1 bacterium]|nr:DUF262 domain-containing protein [candidate division KSB1 bacterium]
MRSGWLYRISIITIVKHFHPNGACDGHAAAWKNERNSLVTVHNVPIHNQQVGPWYEDYADTEDNEIQIYDYAITATPNDFNVLTINQFLTSGAVKIPGFQRNYVWDIGRASKLIESLIMGLPVPQVFLYEEERNRFLVIDGQQRLMSIYYFMSKRFPKEEKRVELRRIFDEQGRIPDNVLHNDEYFLTFNLRLPQLLPNRPNRLRGLNYSTLGEFKTQFELRTIRNVIVKQNEPPNDDSSIYEIFNRLNTGGVNLSPQEIRISLYHSSFYEMLHRLNGIEGWRRFLGLPEPDLHMKDVEVLLRGFALLASTENYTPSMKRFLNQFSKQCKRNTPDQNVYLERLFSVFLDSTRELPEDAFTSQRTRRFNVALFESAFAAACDPAFTGRTLVIPAMDLDRIRRLDADPEFIAASQQGTTQTLNVNTRLRRARAILRDDLVVQP